MIVASIKVKRSYGRKPVPHCAMPPARSGDVPTIPPISVIYRELAERIDELAREYPSRNAFAEAAGMNTGGRLCLDRMQAAPAGGKPDPAVHPAEREPELVAVGGRAEAPARGPADCEDGGGLPCPVTRCA